jgi:hypothetical protein
MVPGVAGSIPSKNECLKMSFAQYLCDSGEETPGRNE